MSIELQKRVEAVRRFNRFYTARIGVLGEGILRSPFSLAKVRVLYELAHRAQPTAAELMRDLGLDRGYLSRMLRGLERRGLLYRAASKQDRRRVLLELTRHGREAFAALDARQDDEVAALVAPLPPPSQRRLVEAMRVVTRVLGGAPEEPAPLVLRAPEPGDLGWIVHRHGALYAREYGYDERFEALVARVVADFVERQDADRERCWIAERDGEVVGSVMLVAKSKTVAKLRLLYVEPSARGGGIGRRLVEECVRYARAVGYRRVVLWTQSELAAARRIYQEAGFRLLAKEPHDSWGKPTVAETWELALT